MKPLRYSLITTIIMGIVVTGCSTSNTTNNAVLPIKNASHSPQQEQDGQVISFAQMQDPNLGSALIPYKMMYWSNQTKVEALVTVPAGVPSTYPLVVFCHGGSSTSASNLSHINPYGEPYTQQDDLQLLANSHPGSINVIPLYRGYGDSDGTVSSINQNTMDANNAIKAIMSKYSVEPHQIQLYGVSMGGFVVLQLASERDDVQSVVATSPFVGWNIVGDWAEKNPTTPLGEKFSLAGLPQLRSNPNDSLQFDKIEAPVLLLQGQNDTNVPWQTVQTLYDEMKADNKNVHLILYPTGNHGLTNIRSNVDSDVTQWFSQIGESTTQ